MGDDIRSMGALAIGTLIKERKASSPEVTRIFLDAALADAAKPDGDETKVNAFISIDEEGAMRQAEEAQRHIDAGSAPSPLAGVPCAVKDNICVRGTATTAASRILEHFVPPYDATVVEKLRGAGAVILGKANLDEFAMGGSTETSYFGVTRNPADLSRVPGGSSGGSAAAVAAGFVPWAVGSDTGGSIRQPCAFTGVTGIKPTYGSVSRYGLMAYASSLDQIGPIARDARDCAAALAILSGPDERDSTDVIPEPFAFGELARAAADGSKDSGEGGSVRARLARMKVGLPTNYFQAGISDDVKETILAAADRLRTLGAQVEEFDLPLIEHAVPAYYIIACAEASSNLSRYDGVKYGYRSKAAQDILSEYTRTRSEGFGTEVKRRIMLGSFVLSSGYFDAYYKKALKVRGLIARAFDEALGRFDFILSPVTPSVAYRIGEQIGDPLAMYLADIYTVSVNLIGAPAIALPCGTGEGGLPVGMQFIGRPFGEETLLAAACAWQER
ncbi:MAG: Asp-tRNA(Asn)/Glu-tRNA(Gln) amidotransferase subunit GatA [Clostridiales Family XIII bacterium]|jgi:aspartyl-tRNA(Asn)/glutamyl-tRNA(Gln) amidotransferase subunit A|nr:Asp-tRNA(Asn)/Glu-tRNA(Gln) amidotransferase subunit GatA [Clostridiales Family XIII bacterium]